jgi:hypothetical protein
MSELPKSVLKRLEAQAPGEHPDANLLTAFSEQALVGRERERIVAHLAACSRCRDVVSLALPHEPAQQPVLALAPWYRRPTMYAWSALLATLVVGAALILNNDQFRSRGTAQSKVADNAPAAAPETHRDQVTMSAPSQTASSAEEAKDLKRSEQPKAKTDQLASMAAPAARAKALEAKKEAVNEPRAAVASNIATMNAAPARPVAAPPPAPATIAEAGSVAKPAMKAQAAEMDAQAAPSARSDKDGSAVGGVVSRRMETAQAVTSANAAKLSKVAVAPRWTVSADGQLQRSLDSGQTWQEVAVAKDARLRAVAVVAGQIWVGGTALYHSVDGGVHWTRQSLPNSTAEITSLSFDDVLRGTARTADGSSWSTRDGGQHWTRQSPQQQ